ncbi:MAG: xanthine dehydrogenase accessory protein XdhC [Betaproteobacteria bacterium]|nr:xanthine dehydrogenase accessory protein XdhC [Betaproteobacteria bacterium]
MKRRAAQWLAQGRTAVLVKVQEVKGSAPRGAGTRMVVAEDEVLGTIGGGHLEWMALATAKGLLQGRQDWPAPQRVALGPTLGQCCGGSVELAYEPLAEASLRAWALPAPRFHLCLYGAGHVGQALVRVLRDIDVSIDWIDSREEAFGTEYAPYLQNAVVMPNTESGLRCWVSEDPTHEAAGAPAGAHHLVMTHHHGLDFDIVARLLQRTDTGWVGLIGSKTKRRQFEHRLRARGLAAERMASLACPVGLDSIAGKEPAVVAVAVAAQLLGLPAGGHQP